MKVKIKATKEQLVSPDGINVITLKVGEEYDLPEDLAAIVVEKLDAGIYVSRRTSAPPPPDPGSESEESQSKVEIVEVKPDLGKDDETEDNKDKEGGKSTEVKKPEDMNMEELANAIEKAGGKPPSGNPSQKALIRLLKSLQEK